MRRLELPDPLSLPLATTPSIPPSRALQIPPPLFVSTQLHWNLWALHLEVWGQSTFAAVWCAGLLFLLANVAAGMALVRGHRLVPFYKRGRAVRLPAAWWPR